MFYWIVPYLLAYNVSDTTDWKNGPIHYFEAEVKANLTSERNEKLYTDVTMSFACRPIDSSLVECRVENSTIDNYEIQQNSTTPVRCDDPSMIDGMIHVYFRIEFDKNGVTRIIFPKPSGYFRENIIRSIIGNLNIGIDLTDKKFGNYVYVDKSINGDCQTHFGIKKISRQSNEKSIGENLSVTKMTIVGFSIDLSESETIVIEKERKMNDCVKKTPYLFGKTEEDSNEPKKGFKMEIDVTSSRSKLYFGKNRFSSYTVNEGLLNFRMKPPNSTNIEKTLKHKTTESTRLTLVAIVEGDDEHF